MSLVFNGSTDRLTASITAFSDADWSLGGWVDPITVGGSNAGLITRMETSGTVREALRFNSSSRDLLAFQSYSTTNAQSITTTTLTLDQWTYVVCTHRASDNKMRVFLGDLDTPMAEASYASQTAGAGTFNGGNTAYIGSHPTNAQVWDGRISQAFAIPRELSLDEMEALRLGDWSTLWRTTTTPTYFLPLDTTSGVDLAKQITFTPTGTTLGEDPQIPAGFAAPSAMPVARVAPAATTGEAKRRAKRDGLIMSDAVHRASRW